MHRNFDFDVYIRYTDFVWKKLTERLGFEPREPFGSTVFKTVALDHSATSPKQMSN